MTNQSVVVILCSIPPLLVHHAYSSRNAKQNVDKHFFFIFFFCKSRKLNNFYERVKRVYVKY